jgi:hypothetical protein
MPRPTLVGRDAEKKGALVSLETVLLLVLTVAVAALLWTAVAVTGGRAETGASGYEAELEALRNGF